MAKILFLTPIYDYYNKGDLFTDLVDALSEDGHYVTIMTPKERKYNFKEELNLFGTIRCLQFRCLNFRGKVNIVEKGISTLSLGLQYKYKFKKYFENETFDLLIYATLPITYSPIVKYVKRTKKSFCYLLQKDFFPQSAVDLGIIKKRSIVYSLFRSIEKKLFKCSDFIGVISNKNVEYILNNNSFLSRNAVEFCPNAIIPKNIEKTVKTTALIRKKYDLPLNKVIFVYGGNMGRAQGVNEIIKLFRYIADNPIDNAFFLFAGSGNEFEKMRIALSGIASVRFFKQIPKQEFDILLSACDVGMIFLDPRFTISNIPSRTLAHLNAKQPILAATDPNTDFRDLIIDNQIGLWSLNGDIMSTYLNICELANDAHKRGEYGQNAYKLLLRENDARAVKNIILKHIQ